MSSSAMKIMTTVKWAQPKPYAPESQRLSWTHGVKGDRIFQEEEPPTSISRMWETDQGWIGSNWITSSHNSSLTTETSEHTSKRFAIQQDDTCDCDLQESETILHLINDCSHHTEERHPMSMAAARVGVDWSPALAFSVQCTTFPLFQAFSKSVQSKKAQAAQTL